MLSAFDPRELPVVIAVGHRVTLLPPLSLSRTKRLSLRQDKPACRSPHAISPENSKPSTLALHPRALLHHRARIPPKSKSD
ncbi:hypothetical protein NL676_015663 [Syzygium grande]|nr:hypothetical protein NL676_015663 [Syzygium grande]